MFSSPENAAKFDGSRKDYTELVVSYNDTTIEGKAIRDIINWNEERKGLKSKGRGCKRCSFNSTCEGVWNEYAKRRGFREFKPVIK